MEQQNYINSVNLNQNTNFKKIGLPQSSDSPI